MSVQDMISDIQDQMCGLICSKGTLERQAILNTFGLWKITFHSHKDPERRVANNSCRRKYHSAARSSLRGRTHDRSLCFG